MVNFGFRGIEVFRSFNIVFKNSRSKTQNPSRKTVNRKNHPFSKSVDSVW